MKISVLVVSLNAGDGLLKTVRSILEQKDADFEIVVKDGGSTDGSLQQLPEDARIRVIAEQDKGIYDAMNQAIPYAQGQYALFLNCGDLFYSDTVLRDIAAALEENPGEDRIYYGDCYTVNRDYILRYPDVFDDYFCFTKVLCHQATVYPTSLLQKRGFDTTYKMAADYEYYTWAYKNGCKLTHIPAVIARYEGGGASETTKNRRLALDERKRAVKTHFSKAEYHAVWRKAQLRGVGIKQALVQIGWLYPLYRKAANVFYRCKRN